MSQLFLATALSIAVVVSVGPPLSFKDVKADISAMLKTNNSIWPIDPTVLTYGPFMIRHAWHCAGSYRISDGKGGCDGARQRFDPERSWEDNANLDKAKHLLYPIKQRYGSALSWGDLIILTGTTAIEDMGFPQPLGFCGGRQDDADGTDSLELGPGPMQEQYAPCVDGQGACQSPLGPTTLGLIYVNPAGPLGVPDPNGSVADVRSTFARMAMNDSETVALIGGGHAFGKTHGACAAGAGSPPNVDPTNPWPGLCGPDGPSQGKGNWTYTSGFEGPWTTTPNLWSTEYFSNLLNHEYELYTGSGGKPQWRMKNATPDKAHLMMLTSDISLTVDPAYKELLSFYMDSGKLVKNFGDAWYKLVTRDMGPVTRCLGDLVRPAQGFQYPLPNPPSSFPVWDQVKKSIRTAMLTVSPALPPDSRLDQKTYYGAAFSTLAWQCSKTFRKSDYLGGCNGARIRYSPQADWPENMGMKAVLQILGTVANAYQNLSYADLIVLAAQVALEDTANLTLPEFCPGRVDAPDGNGSEFLSGYNYTGPGLNLTAAQIFVHKSIARSLTLQEAVVLQGRLRSQSIQKVLGYKGTWGNSTTLSNEYFKILLDPSTTWTCDYKDECKSSKGEIYMLTEDLALRWEPSLFTIAEQYANNNTLFLTDFAWAWNKMVTLDRFKGPNGNVCQPTMPPAPTPAPAVAPVPYGGIIGAGIGGLVLGALVVFCAMRSSNKKNDEMYRAV